MNTLIEALLLKGKIRIQTVQGEVGKSSSKIDFFRLRG
jgi:hypothetical protein